MKIDIVVLIVDDIFEDRTVVKRVVDIGLGFLGKIDRFGVAAALYIEDSLILTRSQAW